MTSLLALVACLGLLLSLTVHVAALLGFNVSEQVPLVWLLHVGIFIVFIPFVILSRKVLGSKPTFAQVRKLFPGWVVALGVLIFAYAIVNFVFFILATQGGSPSIRDGKFVLQNHGRLIRELVVDLGPGQLSAVVRSPQDVLLVLQLAASYEPD